MIEIHPLRDKQKIAELYIENNVIMNKNSMAVICTDCGDCLGFCLFDLDSEALTLHTLKPENDLFLVDGILRSALHVGVENGIMSAFYSESAPFELLKKLKFIKDIEKRELMVDKLFASCKNCENT